MQKPNFTGTWKFNPGKSKLQITPPESMVIVIDHREPVFKMSRTHIVEKETDTFAMELTTDGKEATVEQPNLRLRAHANWDGETLVIHTTVVRSGEEAVNIVRYKLATTPNTMVAEECFRSLDLRYDNTWVMDREEAPVR